jgi:hypothetical protein
MQLTQDQIATYHSEGFLAIEQITTPEDVLFLREVFDRLFADKAGRADGNQFDLAGTDEDGSEAKLAQILQPAKYAPELNDSPLIARTSELLSQLLGASVNASFAHAINKPPHDGAPTPWHQDAAYWDPAYRHNKISVWVPLQRVTVENGCMQFVSGSHLHGVLQHQSINNDPRIHGLELVPHEEARLSGLAKACPLPAGGATFHGGYTLHYAGPNKTETPRRAIILGAELPSTRLPVPVRFPWQEEKQTARLKRMNSRRV